MIKIENLCFNYDGSPVLSGINLTYKKEDFLAIVGPNGGGKSTLLKLILGLLLPTSGKIEIEKGLNLSYVPQFIPINKNFPISVKDVVLMGALTKSSFLRYDKEVRQRALELLEIVGMKDFAKKKISELSGGQRQRVYIARALLGKPDILLLDEPTSSIDLRGQNEIYSLLKELNFKGMGVIIISHDINIALSYATKIAYINKTITMHNISIEKRDDFLDHLATHKGHFCDVELALRSCSCKK